MPFSTGDKALIKNLNWLKNTVFEGQWQDFWKQTATAKECKCY